MSTIPRIAISRFLITSLNSAQISNLVNYTHKSPISSLQNLPSFRNTYFVELIMCFLIVEQTIQQHVF